MLEAVLGRQERFYPFLASFRPFAYRADFQLIEKTVLALPGPTPEYT
jgi:hypothetical protein